MHQGTLRESILPCGCQVWRQGSTVSWGWLQGPSVLSPGLQCNRQHGACPHIDNEGQDKPGKEGRKHERYMCNCPQCGHSHVPAAQDRAMSTRVLSKSTRFTESFQHLCVPSKSGTSGPPPYQCPSWAMLPLSTESSRSSLHKKLL